MSAPPGYSGESLLTGGTATINPVMGGGGFVDRSFSLLTGIPHIGGADEEIKAVEAEAAAAAVVEPPTPAPIIIQENDDSRIEYYKFEYKDNSNLEKTTVSTLKNVVETVYDALNGKPEDREETIKKSPFGPIINDYFNDASGGQTPLNLPATTKNVIVVPPLRGRLEGFDKALTLLNNYGFMKKDAVDQTKVYINPNTVVLFSHPFCGDKNTLNEILFVFFLQIRAANKGRMYILTKPDRSETPVLEPPFTFEPATVKLSYHEAKPGLKFVTEPEPVDVDELSGLEKGIPSQSGQKFRTFLTGDEASYKPPHKLMGDSCAGLYATAQLDDISQNHVLGPINGDDMLMIFRLQPTKPYRPSCMPNIKNPNRFNIVPDDFIAVGDPFDVDLGVVYTLRNPGNDKDIDGNPSSEVYKDWINGNFNEGEVKYLYSINMSPQILRIIYPDSRIQAKVIADFLYDTVISKCFTEETLLTRAQCSKNRELVNKVQEALILHPNAFKEGVASGTDDSYNNIYGPVGISNELDLIDGDEKDLSEPISTGAGDKAGYLFKTVVVTDVKNPRISMAKQIKFAGSGTEEERDALLKDALRRFNERYSDSWEFKSGL
jgi:hypothetical protein